MYRMSRSNRRRLASDIGAADHDVHHQRRDAGAERVEGVEAGTTARSRSRTARRRSPVSQRIRSIASSSCVRPARERHVDRGERRRADHAVEAESSVPRLEARHPAEVKASYCRVSAPGGVLPGRGPRLDETPAAAGAPGNAPPGRTVAVAGTVGSGGRARQLAIACVCGLQPSILDGSSAPTRAPARPARPRSIALADRSARGRASSARR